jgi:hypothetical protein
MYSESEASFIVLEILPIDSEDLPANIDPGWTEIFDTVLFRKWQSAFCTGSF